MGIPLLMGRDFTDKDERLEVPKDDNGFRVAIANEHFAKNAFAGRNPIGGHIGFGSNPTRRHPSKSSASSATREMPAFATTSGRDCSSRFLRATIPVAARSMRGRPSRRMRCSRP